MASGHRAHGAMAAGLLALVFVLRLPGLFHEQFDPDEAAIASMAIAVQDGGTMYVEAVDRKPPVAPMVYAATFDVAGVDLRATHLVGTIAIAVAAIAIALDLRRRHGPAAAWWGGVLLATGAVGFFPTDGQSTNFAHLAIAPATLAVLWARRPGWRWAASAGVAFAVAVLTRQSWTIGALALVVALVVHAGPPPDRVRRVAACAVAGLVVLASMALVVPFDELWRWTFVGNESFLAAPADLGATAGRALATVATFVGFHLLAVVVVARAEPAAIDAVRHGRVKEDLDLWVWLATGLFAVVAGLRFFGHYWLQALPPLVLLAAPRAAALAPRWRRPAIAAVAVPAAVAFAFAWFPTTFRSHPDVDDLAAYVRAHSEPGDPVWVWGSLPEVHLAAERPPGGGQVHSDFVTGRSGGRAPSLATLDDATPGAREAMLRQLRADPPAVFVDTTGTDTRGYDEYPLAEAFPEAHDFLVANYEPATEVDGFEVWLPKAAGPTGG